MVKPILMPRGKSLGFTYLALLFIVAIMGASLALTGHLWQKVSQRQKERELLFIGDQFRRAILLYYERTPGGIKQYPKELADLVKDERYPSVQRYLREVYRDPITGTKDWGLVQAPEGGIMGIHSLAVGAPQKTEGFSEQYSEFSNKQNYSEWRFIYRPNDVVGVKAAPKLVN